MKPIIKYLGGKYKEIPNFIDYIPKEFNTYIEPFIGGGALYFYLEPKKAIINDINEKLITFYSTIKNNHLQLNQEINKIIDKYNSSTMENNKIFYYYMRNRFNNNDNVYLDATIYYFINKTCFSGLSRINSSGKFNVPFSYYDKINNNITEKHINLLKNTQIYNVDYSQILRKAKKDDFIFIDPPYPNSYNKYANNDVFDEQEQIRLATNFKNLSCKSLMIINETALTKELYKKYIYKSYNKRYAINIKNRINKDSTHLIISNYL